MMGVEPDGLDDVPLGVAGEEPLDEDAGGGDGELGRSFSAQGPRILPVASTTGTPHDAARATASSVRVVSSWSLLRRVPSTPVTMSLTSGVAAPGRWGRRRRWWSPRSGSYLGQNLRLVGWAGRHEGAAARGGARGGWRRTPPRTLSGGVCSCAPSSGPRGRFRPPRPPRTARLERRRRGHKASCHFSSRCRVAPQHRARASRAALAPCSNRTWSVERARSVCVASNARVERQRVLSVPNRRQTLGLCSHFFPRSERRDSNVVFNN